MHILHNLYQSQNQTISNVFLMHLSLHEHIQDKF